MTERRTGLITKAQSRFFTVYTESGSVVCTLRGHLQKKRLDTDLVALGDQATFITQPDGTGIIESIAERERVLGRRAPRGNSQQKPKYHDRPVEQVLVANPDQAVFVFSCTEPDPNLRMLDRFLVAACASRVPALICANKIDLVDGRAGAAAIFHIYENIGYRVEYTSASKGDGIDHFHAQLGGKISALAGPSGAGKSTLMNAIQPGLRLATQAVGKSTKGRHTTVFPQLLPLEGGGWVADTPGLRSLDFFDLEPEELDGYFVEIAPLVAECAFSDCSHTHEPHCAVRSAVEDGKIHPLRYESFKRMRHMQASSGG